MRRGGKRYDRHRGRRGKRLGGRQLWRCAECRKWRTEGKRREWSAPEFCLARTEAGWSIVPPDAEGLPVTRDERGRARVGLGSRFHPFGNRAGNQWLGRFLVMEALSELWWQRDEVDPDDPLSFPFGDVTYARDPTLCPLTKSEHVHHVNGDRADDDAANYEVWLAEYHGSHHATALTTHRRIRGRFAPVESSEELAASRRFVPRWGAIIGPSAEDLLRSIGRREV